MGNVHSRARRGCARGSMAYSGVSQAHCGSGAQLAVLLVLGYMYTGNVKHNPV